mgnify:CR=1 FL=1
MEIIKADSLEKLNTLLIYEDVIQIGVLEPLNNAYFTRHLDKNLQFFQLNTTAQKEYFALVDNSTIASYINYNAIPNETVGKWYIEVSVLDEKLDSTTIKSMRQIMESGDVLLLPVSITPNIGDKLVFEVATTTVADLVRNSGRYRYEVVKADDSVYRFYFDYDKEKVLGVHQILDIPIADYNVFFNYENKLWYLDINIPDKQFDTAHVKSIKMTKKAGVELGVPEEITVGNNTMFLFDVAEANGSLAYRGNGEYRYEVITQEDIKYVFHFNYDSSKVVGVEEMVEASVDYKGTFSETDNLWYLDITVPNEDLDTTKVKTIKMIVKAGEVLDIPEDIIVGSNIKYSFDIADNTGNLTYRNAGMYLFEAVRQNDTKFIFYFDYDVEKVTDVTEII